MIESFMLEANETVATHFESHNLPFIYRIHEQPKADRLQRFIDFAATFGMTVEMKAGEVDQKDLQAFLNKVKGEPGEMVLSTMLLRSMQQARYSETNAGHFGLAAEDYTHFTSPIRRYPDLLVHRLIREIGEGKISDALLQRWEEKIPEIAEHSSHRERRAVDAEREVEKMKKAEFMEEHVGEEFDGVIASVTRFGMFVELENTIEGLIHISTLKGDFFTYHERMLALIGERTGLSFKIGQPVKIKVAKADKTTGEIDFTYLPSELDVVDQTVKVKKKPSQKRRKPSDKAVKVKNVTEHGSHGGHGKNSGKTGAGHAGKSGKKPIGKYEKSEGGRNSDSKRSDRPVSKDWKQSDGEKKKKSNKKPFYTKAAKGKFSEGRKKAHKQY
jgi:ribonuclease R